MYSSSKLTMNYGHPAAIELAGAIAPPPFSKIVLKAITIMSFSSEIFSEPNYCIQKGRKVAKPFLKGAFSDLLRGVV